MFVIDAVPLPTNTELSDIAGARVHVWVISNDKESAKIRALDYIAMYQWKVSTVERELEIQPEQISGFHEAEIALYLKAQQFGIAADFLAYPKSPGNPTDPVRKIRLRSDN
jgi:hypothetical protein